MVVHPDEIRLPGITGVVWEGILPALYGYEAGQVAVGDMLAWFRQRLAPPGSTLTSLEEEAALLEPGQTGLVALDWWNGNRTVLADADLTGVLCGLTLQSTSADLYRALLESIAFGNRRIVENFSEHGLELTDIVACGGVAIASPLLMQLFADVSGLEVRVPDSSEVPARGAALFGAVASQAFADIGSAIAATRPQTARTYKPDRDAKLVYDRVYAVYLGLHDLLGRSRVELLHELKHIRTERRAA
jgi:L-ribulokinase